jgi:arylsulfatase
MDREVGRVVEQLRAMNALDNTLICFLSDNGASAEIMVRDDGHDPSAPAGSAGTHLCLGPGWSTVANTPFRMHKTWVHEGGIATPLLVHWPQGIAARGELRRTPGHVIDLVPTILEAAGGQRTDNTTAAKGPPPPGESLIAAFGSENRDIDNRDKDNRDKNKTGRKQPLWWSHEGSRAIRVGDWKLVAAAPSLRGRGGRNAQEQQQPGPWELFNLAADRAETNNLAEKMPDKVRELAELWSQKENEFFQVARQDAAP